METKLDPPVTINIGPRAVDPAALPLAFVVIHDIRAVNVLSASRGEPRDSFQVQVGSLMFDIDEATYQRLYEAGQGTMTDIAPRAKR